MGVRLAFECDRCDREIAPDKQAVRLRATSGPPERVSNLDAHGGLELLTLRFRDTETPPLPLQGHGNLWIFCASCWSEVHQAIVGG